MNRRLLSEWVPTRWTTEIGRKAASCGKMNEGRLTSTANRKADRPLPPNHGVFVTLCAIPERAAANRGERPKAVSQLSLVDGEGLCPCLWTNGGGANGTSALVIDKILDHSSEQTMKRYAHLTRATVLEEANNVSSAVFRPMSAVPSGAYQAKLIQLDTTGVL